MKQRSWRSLVPWALILLCPIPTYAGKLTIERLFAAPDLSGPQLRAPQISPDGRYVTYLRGKDANKDQLDLWAYDLRTKRHRLLVDSSRLMPAGKALSAEEEARRERQRTSSLSGILEYSFSADSRSLLVPLGGDLFVYDLRAAPENAVRRLTTTESYETDARFSPRGRYVSFVRDQNLVVYDLVAGREQPVTRDGGGLVSFGMAEFIAQEEMNRDTGYWWSPDDSRIAFARVDESPVAEVERFEIYADNVQVVKQRYPFTGARNADVQLFVATLKGEDNGGAASRATGGAQSPAALPPAVRIDLGANPDIYLARVDWFPDSRSLAVQREARDLRSLTLLKADAATGTARELLTERSETWIDLHHDLTFLERSPRFIWASQRDGYKHLYLYDLDGRLERPLTHGDWMVVGDGDTRAIAGVDERRGLVYFMSNAASPLERHLYSVSLRDPAAPMRKVTAATGWHSVQMSQDARVFIDTWSTEDRPPSVTLRSADGTALTTLLSNELTPDHPYAPYLDAHRPSEFGTLTASDGQTMYYQIIRPEGMEPGRRYPAIVDVYGGPTAQRVQRSWSGLFRQYLAQQGYVVFALDNRGSGFRGRRFEGALNRHLGSVEVEDQVRGARFLASLPYVDPARIGIFGWSYGGYMTLMCLMQSPGTFAAGVAGAPVTDWKLYDTFYTERFMGTPQENAAGYAAASVSSHAGALRDPLLIIHGMADDNVLFTHSTSLFKKLQDLGKPFDVMVYPGSKHGLLRHADTGPHAYHTIERFFDAHLRAHPSN